MPVQSSFSTPSIPKVPARITTNLVVGANLITHSLGLVTPFTTVVDARTSIGAVLGISRSLETANSITITSGIAVTGAQITVSG